MPRAQLATLQGPNTAKMPARQLAQFDHPGVPCRRGGGDGLCSRVPLIISQGSSWLEDAPTTPLFHKLRGLGSCLRVSPQQPHNPPQGSVPSFHSRVGWARHGNNSPAQSDVEEITVGPWRVGCYEEAPVTAACIVVNGEPYYGVIEEFPRGHGFEYRLSVERYDLFSGVTGPPPELPRYGYRLLAVLSEMPASHPPSTN